MISIEKYHGRNASNYRKVLEKFINNSIQCVKSKSNCLSIIPVLFLIPGLRISDFLDGFNSMDTASLLTVLIKTGTLFLGR